MNNILKSTIFAVSAGIICLTVTCCESEGKSQIYAYPEPTVTHITPERGYTGSQLAICGDNFGNRTEPVSVFFGDLEANVLACKNDMIIVKVPEGARSCDVSLKIWKYEYSSVGYYTIIDKPSISDISTNNPLHPYFGTAGDILTISGNSFGNDPANVRVTVGIVDAPVRSVSDSEIKAEIPQGYGYGNVSVDINGYEAVGGRLIDPAHTGDLTSYALVNYAQPFVATEDAPVANWCIPTGWQFNDAFYATNNGEKELMRPLLLEPNGNYKLGAIGYLCNQWTDANHKYGFSNAKMFQTAYLPAGEYEITVYVSECVLLAGTLEVICGVSKGIGTLPDMAGTDGVAGWTVTDESVFFGDGRGGKSYLRLTDDKAIAYEPERGSVPMSFHAVIDENSDVTIGFTGNVKMAGNRQGGDILISKIKVERIF